MGCQPRLFRSIDQLGQDGKVPFQVGPPDGAEPVPGDRSPVAVGLLHVQIAGTLQLAEMSAETPVRLAEHPA